MVSDMIFEKDSYSWDPGPPLPKRLSRLLAVRHPLPPAVVGTDYVYVQV